ncbi:MAG: metallophosphatase [Fluviicola sp.]|nr:metallophosphatase [Fluviicola sp.]
MKRRTFVRNSVVVSGGLLVAPSILAQSSKKNKTEKLTILHTNDTHSNIDPFPENHSKYPGKGGVARRYELIQKVRAEEEHVLLLDAGDIFQGTPYFNKFGGVLEMKLMTELGYDVATMGNHDFDGGLEGFVKARKHAKFPFVCSNYEFSNTPIDGFTQEFTIIQKGKIKVGIFGIGVEMKGLVPDNKYGETKYLDPIEIANDRAEELKRKDCDLVICLSHLGYEYGSEKVSDRILAQKTKNIHLIIGGHTHTFLDKPTEEKNLIGETVLVNQVGWAGINVGRIDFDFEQKMFAKKDVIVVK